MPRFQLLGEGCALLELGPGVDADFGVGAQQRLLALAEQLRSQGLWLEVVPGRHNLGLQFDPLRHAGAEVLARLQQAWALCPTPAAMGARELQIPVHYGGDAGPDLAEAAAHCGLSVAAFVDQHSAPTYEVAFLGFQPGFAYLEGLPQQLHCPRRAEPRLRVPAGSLGIGGAQTGIYPAASPGGWQLIGRTDLRLFDPQRQPACLLQPGDRIRFVPQ
ncbi:KipI family sensor histidine kinase inhibitor [Inhella inkyongensis]|uniref:KipI family sensor histidine kinase inhibitor n=2 Tax=Inhella inkyongensis TaxID=392593 RepID=A0A840S821_9BURK|nr:5-oxoprolinase subunit PxpB [Inhella inkyongensis]MBB5204590.1 KipI family sensor histidine kinase inhibitor [Inhella inkyongensis]